MLVRLPKTIALPLLATILAMIAATPASAQRRVAITGDRLSGTVLPVAPLDGDIELAATRAWTWTVDDTKRLRLRGDVQVTIGGRHFEAPEATVWINRLPTAAGLVTQIAVYGDEIVNPLRPAGVGVAGRALLVTGSVRGATRLDVVKLEPRRPRPTGLIRRGEARLAEHRRRLLAAPPRLASEPAVDRPADTPIFEPVPGDDPAQTPPLPSRIELPDPREPWLREPGAVLRFSFGAVEVQPGAEENVITATDSVVIEYFSARAADDLSQLTLSADRAVIFTEPGSLEEMATWELDAARIRGIYLEGNVTASANDGEYLVRAPRVYYDLQSDRAIMLEAVLRTYERRGRLPIYARAVEMQQISANQWTATGATVTTSEFRTGHLALGAERLTMTQRPATSDDPDEDVETYIQAEDISFQVGGTPIFAWPSFAGRMRDVPIRRLQVGGNSNDGVSVETGWDLMSLLTRDRPRGIDAMLKLDGYSKRGPAVGLDLTYDVGDAWGAFDLYGLYDEGIDRTSSGRDVDPDPTLRGVALWEHRMELSRHWDLQTQASYISDRTFITAWREEDFRERRAYETSALLLYQKDDTAFTLLGKYDLDDFISNGWLLASQPYTVDKLPEATYRVYGESFFGTPLSYSAETRVGAMRMQLQDGTPRELGARPAAFGLADADDDIEAALLARGLSHKQVNRFDSRHELTWPLTLGGVRATPFAVGRFTAYDDDFAEFAGETDDSRVFGAIGVRLATQFQHVDNAVESQLFDLHRLRHLVEPNATIWYGYNSIADDALPIYDLDVEGISSGAAMRLGVRNTWQTQRGGPGRWRSVDVLKLDTDLVVNSGDADPRSPSPRFFDYRPEYSQMGDHVSVQGVWAVSDTLSLAGESIVDLDESAVARGAIGAELRHSPRLLTYVEYRYLDASDNELLELGWNYVLTPTYRFQVRPQWDFRRDEFRSFDVRVIRGFPDFELTIQVRRDEIQDETTLGASIDLLEF
ncbi:MAG: LPS assembly protein LptD, partial [Phycisphaerales bacterium]|nr:LPS-assembly protein LptD [Phycisphaerae bacterium]NNF43494.1 LPS assembly protein LptD [Phycisphaerales bacterium]NNM26370.1 LPS assembly protein LptD [Phycisphaerales bacterium]